MCEPLKQSELDKIHHGKEVTSATFILVERGGCSFTTKVRNVEDAGASLAIIIDNKDEDVEMVNMVDDGAGAGIRIPSMLISKRDGQRMIDYIRAEQRKVKATEDYEKKRNGGYSDGEDEDKEDPCEGREGDEKVNCEAAEAEKAREKAQKEEEENEKKKESYSEGTLKLLATFNMTNPDDHVEYSIWMSSSSDKALDFIEDFTDYALRFHD